MLGTIGHMVCRNNGDVYRTQSMEKRVARLSELRRQSMDVNGRSSTGGGGGLGLPGGAGGAGGADSLGSTAGRVFRSMLGAGNNRNTVLVTAKEKAAVR